MTDITSGQNTSPAEELVLVEDRQGVRFITINRPSAHNSLDRPLRAALLAAFTDATSAAEANNIRSVVVRAAGQAFCSGQDLKEQLLDMQKYPENLKTKVTHEYNPMVAALAGIPVPVIAAIQGPAAGAGWGLAMACDFRIMSEQAVFKGAFTGVGLAADSALSTTLVHSVGRAQALQLLLLDEKIPAAEAEKLGLVTQVVPAEEVDHTAAALATRLAAGPTASYKEMKSLVKQVDVINAAADAEAGAQERLSKTQDHLEAIQAFIEKRTPNFKGC